jgi:hypothetical protein
MEGGAIVRAGAISSRLDPLSMEAVRRQILRILDRDALNLTAQLIGIVIEGLQKTWGRRGVLPTSGDQIIGDRDAAIGVMKICFKGRRDGLGQYMSEQVAGDRETSFDDALLQLRCHHENKKCGGRNPSLALFFERMVSWFWFCDDRRRQEIESFRSQKLHSTCGRHLRSGGKKFSLFYLWAK